MFLRGARAAEPRRARRAAPARRAAARAAGPAGADRRLHLRRRRSSCCPFDFRQALINTLIGTVMALSLVVITGFVGQISVVQLALAGRRRLHRLPPRRRRRASASRWRRSSASPSPSLLGHRHRRLGAAGARREPGRRHARGRRGHRATSASSTRRGAAAQAARRCPTPHLFGLDLGPDAGFRGLDGNAAQPRVRLGRARRHRGRSACSSATVRRGDLGPADAGRALQRAGRGRGRDQRPRNVKLAAFAISAFIAGRRRIAVRLQLRLGERRPLRRAHRARPDRLRLHGRHHARLGRRLRRAASPTQALFPTPSTSGSA